MLFILQGIQSNDGDFKCSECDGLRAVIVGLQREIKALEEALTESKAKEGRLEEAVPP